MTDNRLPYQTLGGNLHQGYTFEQLREYLVKASEDALALERWALRLNRPAKAAAWRTVKHNLLRCAEAVSALGNKRSKTGVGYEFKIN